jgi:ElaB/YqjD/DUF883 family membrane-anchored ribosome-binding protein
MEANVHRVWCWRIPGNYSRAEEKFMTNAKTVTETASELGRKAKESFEELGRGLDDARGETGGALHAAASSVRSAGQACGAIDDFAARAADRLDATGSYIEKHDVSDAFTGLRRFARRHPTRTMLVAAAIGFIAGHAISRATHSR